MNVIAGSARDNTGNDRLWAEYRGAFHIWASRVKRLQAVTSVPDDRAVREAREQVAAAETVYRNCRDRLIYTMVSGQRRMAAGR